MPQDDNAGVLHIMPHKAMESPLIAVVIYFEKVILLPSDNGISILAKAEKQQLQQQTRITSSN